MQSVLTLQRRATQRTAPMGAPPGCLPGPTRAAGACLPPVRALRLLPQALDIRGCRELIRTGIIAGGMIPKVSDQPPCTIAPPWQSLQPMPWCGVLCRDVV